MKILVLTKRFGTNKDLVMQNFGRQIRLFEHIQKLGHKVDFLCMDYVKFESKKARIKNIDYYIEPFSIGKFNFFKKKLNFLLKNNKYDVIVPSTSPLLGIIAYFYSKKYKIKMLYELQDSFSIYDEYKIPFVRQIDKYVTKNCDVVVCVSRTLLNKIRKFRKKPSYVIENGIERNLFRPLDKTKCRKKLNLPLDAKIIVYIGHITKLKGFDILLEAFAKVREEYPNTHLLLSGKIDKDIDIRLKNVLYHPLPKREQVAMAINASDVAVNPDPKNAFTEYCFPYKIVEYMACKIPIVATDVGDASLILKKYGSVCNPNANDLAEKIISKLQKYKRVRYNELDKLDWIILAKRLEKIMNSLF